MNKYVLDRYVLPLMAMMIYFGPGIVSALGTANLMAGNMRGLVMFALPAVMAWFAWQEWDLWGFDGMRKVQLFSWACGIALGGFAWLLAEGLRALWGA